MTHAAALPATPAHRVVGRAGLRADVLCAVALSLLAVLVFANALANDFVLDDRGILLGNPLVQQLTESWRAFTLPYWPEALGGGQYRPLGILHFALDWRLSGGDALWFHAANLAWHALATLLVWRLATQLMRPWAAVACAALFAVHPVHVEAVANVVGRLESMATVFTLGALLAHRARSWFAVPLLALGLLSKENAIVTLALFVASDVLLPQAPSHLARSSHRQRALYISYGIVVVAYGATLWGIFHNRPFSVETGTLADASFATRLWTMATVVPHYVRLLLLPAALSADYEPQVIPAADGPTAAGMVGILLFLLYGVALLIACRRSRTLAFALAWVGLALAPVSNVFFVSGVTLAERALYLPSVGAVLALGIALDAAAQSQRRALAFAGAAILLSAGTLRTWTRTPAWRDDRAYAITLLTDHPESYRAHWFAGRVHMAAGRLDAATRELELARRIFSRSPRLYLDAANVAVASGDPSLAAALRDSATALERSRP